MKKIKNILKKILGYQPNVHRNNDLKLLKNNKTEVLILGSAPSVNKLDFSKINNQFIISSANFHEHKDIDIIKPDIHVFAASHEPITKNVMMNWFKRCHKKLPQSTAILVEERDRLIALKSFQNRKVFFYSYGGKLPVNFNKRIMSPWSVGVVCLQLGVFLNFKKIYLLGIDHDWQFLKPYKHFYSHDKESLEYYGSLDNIVFENEISSGRLPKKRLYTQYELYQQYELLNSYASKRNIIIRNGDENTGFDVFPFCYDWKKN